MSSTAPYARIEKAIAASDVGVIRQRWEYGRRLLVDPARTTPTGNLRNDVMPDLIATARRLGRKLSEREIQHRLQAARQYPSEAHITHICASYETWGALRKAGFPPVQLPLDADTTPYDPRSPEERARDAGRALGAAAERDAGQLALFPSDLFDEMSTLAELEKHAAEMAAWTERQADRDRKREAYLGRLLDAVGGDRNRTWGDAQAALDAQQAP